MMEKNRWDDMGNYMDEDTQLVDTVVKQVEREIAPSVRENPAMTVNQIKIQAMNRFIDLIEKQLLTQREAERCYQRFVQLVHYYYGS